MSTKHQKTECRSLFPLQWFWRYPCRRHNVDNMAYARTIHRHHYHLNSFWPPISNENEYELFHDMCIKNIGLPS